LGLGQTLRAPVPAVGMGEPFPSPEASHPILLADAGAVAAATHVNEIPFEFVAEPIQAQGQSVGGP